MELTIPDPAILEVFHSNCLIGIIMNFILMVDKLFRITFPVTGEKQVFNTTFGEGDKTF
ncbi:hypothetical protein D3C85_1738660 [compost metagenome]